jgi:hypothetical protein
MLEMMIVTETIWNKSNLVVPMALVQHIEKLSLNGKSNGLWLITSYTRWNYGRDNWENPAYVPQEDANDFLAAWCRYRYEADRARPVLIQQE